MSEAWELLDQIWADHRRREISLEDAIRKAQAVRMEHRLALTNQSLTGLLTDEVRPRVRWQQAHFIRERVRLAQEDGTAPDPRAITPEQIARLFDVPEHLVTAGSHCGRAFTPGAGRHPEFCGNTIPGSSALCGYVADAHLEAKLCE